MELLWSVSCCGSAVAAVLVDPKMQAIAFHVMSCEMGQSDPTLALLGVRSPLPFHAYHRPSKPVRSPCPLPLSAALPGKPVRSPCLRPQATVPFPYRAGSLAYGLGMPALPTGRGTCRAAAAGTLHGLVCPFNVRLVLM